jgi:hypothetical protein
MQVRWTGEYMFLCLFTILATGHCARPSESIAPEQSREPVVIDSAALDAICARVRVLPIADAQFRGEPREAAELLGTQTYADLQTALTISDAQLHSLIDSVDARKRSLAVFIAWQRANSPLLLTLGRRFAGSSDAAIPGAGSSSSAGASPAVPQTLGSYVDRVFHAWFDRPAIAEPDEFDKVFPGYPSFVEAKSWVVPWLNRVRRAEIWGDKDERNNVAAKLLELPELNRVVVVSLRSMDGTPPATTDSVKLLGSVSRATRDELHGNALFLPRDPMFSRKEPGYDSRREVVAAFDRLTK